MVRRKGTKATALHWPTNLNRRAYFQCNSTVDLENGTPFFLVSQNYPYSPFDYSYCTVTFNSEDAIRLAIYDLVTIDAVVFEGPNLSEEPARISLSGRHVTDDEPVALYFSKSVTVSFAFRNTSTYYTRGFYILVDSYTRMQYETEKCCDVMLIDGIAPPPYNVTIYFFTPTYGINLDVYDGVDADADAIYTRWLYDKLDGAAPKISSTGQHILIRIRPNIYNTKATLDFQAMVTDWQPGVPLDKRPRSIKWDCGYIGKHITSRALQRIDYKCLPHR
ncbi:hypothetical protein TELCIR_06212 [Teladorsagia circumcincta]|uniref:CUB domain protein n=1 Tax=Teladorsagia circumcincta TaxID=45464 RepID=A0A2G9UNY7_TELCI|nr:hypothetical protein TELCIR_06212 [Teladorsagia circumcincta]